MTLSMNFDGETRVRCSLYSGNDYVPANRRAAYFHLLWHRDAGDAIPQGLLDELNPDFDPLALPPHDPQKKGRNFNGTKGQNFPHGSYGDRPHDLVLPDYRGRPRGKLPKRRSAARE